MQESKNFCPNYLTKFAIDLNGIWYTVETCWCCEVHTYFVLLISKGKIPACVILFGQLYIVLYSDIYRPISFKLDIVMETTKLYFFLYQFG